MWGPQSWEPARRPGLPACSRTWLPEADSLACVDWSSQVGAVRRPRAEVSFLPGCLSLLLKAPGPMATLIKWLKAPKSENTKSDVIPGNLLTSFGFCLNHCSFHKRTSHFLRVFIK